MRIALALLAAARGEPLTTPVLIGAAEVLRLSPNAMRIALSRLTTTDDVITQRRGTYALSPRRLQSYVQVRRNGFATRIPWKGDYLGVLTADLPRRSATLVRRRTHALDVAGFRELSHGLFVRPDNLAGGRATVAPLLQRLGLDPGAELIGVSLDARQSTALEQRWQVSADARRAQVLEKKVKALLPIMRRRPPRQVAATSFWLGDEVLRFLARDPLLPERWADPAPRRKLAEVMSALDEQGLQVWRSLLETLGEKKP